MVAQAVADDQLDVGERERLGGARLVDPAQRAGADHELVLPEEPVGGRVVVGAALRAREVEAGDADAAALVAPHVEARAVDQSCAKRGSSASSERGDKAAKTRGKVSATRCSASSTRTSRSSIAGTQPLDCAR